MKTRSVFVGFGLGVLMCTQLAGIPSASAQYMFLDTDGDGVFTSSDAYLMSRCATVDLYLVSNQNYDGSPAYCPEGGPIEVFSYVVNLTAYGDAVTFTNITDQLGGGAPMLPMVIYPNALSIGKTGFQTLPPGKHKLLSMTVTSGHGCPALTIEPTTCYSPPGVVTSLGASCFGQQFDNTLRLGEDWWYGPGSGFCLHNPGLLPTVSCPEEVLGVEGEPLAFLVRTLAPSCGSDPLSFYNIPPG